MPRAVRLLAVLAAVALSAAAAPAVTAVAQAGDYCDGYEEWDSWTHPDYEYCEWLAEEAYGEDIDGDGVIGEPEEAVAEDPVDDPEPVAEDEAGPVEKVALTGLGILLIAFMIWLAWARDRGRRAAGAASAPAAPATPKRPRRKQRPEPQPKPEPQKRPKLPPVDAALREVAEADLVSLGEQLGEMEIEVDLPTTPEAARAAYHEAVGSYQLASEQAEQATAIEELHVAARTVATGRFRLQVAQALIAGEEPPRNAAPCFFDPRHGVSVGEVGWMTLVAPACAGCRDRAMMGGVAEPLTITGDGMPGPYWEKPLWDAYYAGAQPAFPRAVEDEEGILVSMFRRVQ